MFKILDSKVKLFFNLLPKHMIVNLKHDFRKISSSTAAVTKVGRSTYTRMYPTLLVLPDGSTINIRYHEPRKIITLPLDINTLNEAEKKIRLNNRKPRRKLEASEEMKYTFKANKYVDMLKKK